MNNGDAPEQRGYAGYTELARWIVLAALMLGTILETLDVSIVNVAIPEMMGNLGATLDQVNWVSTGYIIANVIILPLSGWLSAYFGRRRYLAGSIIVFTVASFFCGVATSLDALIAFRILQGAGGAALLSTAMAVLLEIFPPAQQGLVAAIFGVGVMTGPTLGPIVGGWITDNYSWPWIFFINLPIGTPAAILTILFMRDVPGEREAAGRKVDVVGILLLAIGVGALQVVLERGNREDWLESAMIRWLDGVAAVGLSAFVAWELRVAEPAVNLRVLRNRGLAAGTVYSAVVGFGIYSTLFILPVFLQQVRGYTAMQTGTMMIVDGVTAAVSMAIAGKLVTRFPSRNLVGLGTLSFVAAMILLSGVTLDTGFEHLWVPYLLRGASLGFLFVPLSLAALAGLQGKDMGDASGLFNLTRQWGGSVGIACLSTIIDHRTSFHRAMIVENLTVYSAETVERLQSVTAYLVNAGSDAATAADRALAVTDRIVQGQATVMAFEDSFLVIGLVFVFALPLLFLFKKAVASGGLPPSH